MSSQVFPPPSVVSSTNLGPLTTSLSFPPNCLEGLYDLQTTGLGVTWTYETQGCALSTCCPQGNYYTEGWGWFSSYYSPAVCPSQYKSCAPYSALRSQPDETVIFCCPQSYDCPSGPGYWACQSGLTTDTIVTVLRGMYDQEVISTRTFTATPGWTSSQVAYPIQIRFKDSDLSTAGGEVFVTASVATTDAQPTASTDSGPSVTGTSDGSTGSSRKSSLSTGARTGIGIGVALGVSALISLISWFLVVLRRKKSRTPHPAANTNSGNPPPHPSMFHQPGPEGMQVYHPSNDKQVVEGRHDNRVPELANEHEKIPIDISELDSPQYRSRSELP